MDEKRKGEIAYLILKRRLGKEGLFLGKSRRRELGNLAKAVGISLSELEEFGREVSKELIDETFGKE